MCQTGSMSYDTSNLARLGKQRAKLLEQLEANRVELHAEIVDAREAGVPQDTVSLLAKVTRETVRTVHKAARERRSGGST